jgi:NitT/TauT family transport system permease protein
LVTGLHLVSGFFLPSPQTFIQALALAITKEGLFSYAMTTVEESVGGCLLAAAVGLPLGYAIAKSHLISSAVEPYLAAIQAVPAVALAPLFALWIGYGLVPVILLCALLVFFPIVINTALGINMIDRAILEATQVEGASRWATLRFIEMPLALPTLLAGFRTGFTLSITGSVVGEFVIGGTGLGQLLITQRNYSDSAGEFATLFFLALLAILVYTLVRLLEAKAAERTQ